MSSFNPTVARYSMRKELRVSIPELARLAVIRAVVAKRLRQGVAKRLRQGVAKRLRQGMAKRLRQGMAKRLRQGMAKRLRQGMAKRLRQGVVAQGRLVAFYPDKYRVLRVNQPVYPGKCPNPGHGLRSKDDISILG